MIITIKFEEKYYKEEEELMVLVLIIHHIIHFYINQQFWREITSEQGVVKY